MCFMRKVSTSRSADSSLVRLLCQLSGIYTLFLYLCSFVHVCVVHTNETSNSICKTVLVRCRISLVGDGAGEPAGVQEMQAEVRCNSRIARMQQ